jgi:predicted transcriptional regulator
MKRKNPETSIEAYRSLDVRRLNETYRQILVALDSLREATFEEIAAFIGCSPAKVWKRLSELNRTELIHRPGNKKALKSGKMGYTWRKGKAEEKDDLQRWWDEYQQEPVPPPKPTFHQTNLF